MESCGQPASGGRLLLAHALGLTRADLIRDPGREVETETFHALLDRRCAHEPLAHILGRREFWSLDFEVSAATLIPAAGQRDPGRGRACGASPTGRAEPILDLGTGTGCLLLALLQEFPDAFGIGIDIAPEPPALARANADRTWSGRSSGFLCRRLDQCAGRALRPVVSNPPYIRAGDIAGLMPEVARYEPRAALDGGVGRLRRLPHDHP